MALFDGARRPLHVFAAFLLAALALFATLAEAANPVRLFALSTRANVVQGDNVLITGFVIEGSRPKTVVLRARGPSIGVANALADPMLTLVPAAGGPPVVNDDWWTAANSATLAASGFAPDHAKESALLATLDPGVYTAVVSGVAGSTGLALVEVYEFDTPDASLSGISARALVGAGDAVMIAGFIVTGDAPLPVVVRARGPSLATVGVSGALEDPLLQLVRASDQVVIATNDDWESAPNAADIAASGFPPADPRESAILMPLEPGAYTAVVSDVGNRAGVAIIEVFEAAQAPVITSADATTFIAGTQGNFVVTATGKPAPTLSLSGALPSGVTFDPATGALSGTPGPATGGVYALTFTASNGVDGPATQAFTLTVHQAPAITSGNAVTFNVGVAGMFTVTATGFPTPVLALASGTLPAGITFDAATGILSGTPATGTGGTYPLTFSATNAAATATQAFTLTVGAVRITSANTATFTVGTAGSFTVTTSATPVAATITRSGALPNGVTFVNNGDGTATLAGTPAPGTGGTYAITIQAGNGVGVPASQNFTLVVNQAAAITSANATTFVIGAAGSFTVVATGFPTPTLTLTGALPSGVTFNAATGVLSGVPAAGTGGSYPLTFTALNGVVPNATQAFTLTVNQAPAVTSVNTATFVVGTPGTFTVVTAAVPTATLITHTGTLPAGVSFTNNGNGTATLAGTPAAGTGGTYPLAISASNGVPPNATQSFKLTVNEAPAITSPNGTTFTVGTAGSFTVSVTGFPAPTLSLVGALPSGVSFDTSSGVLSGAPAPGSGGTYPVTFTATSSAGTANQAFTLTVVAPAAAANDAHSTVHDTLLNVAAPGVLSNDSGVPAPTVSSVSGSGAPCSAFPCTVSTTHGSVTLASDGSFTYTPSADFAGSDTFTYTATNATGSSSATVTLTVTNAAPVVDLNGTAGGIGFTATFTEGGAAVAIVDPAQLTVTDADDTQLTGATIVITNPIDGASESLSLACPDVSPGCSGAILAANVTYTPATHTLEILATASLADFQALLRTLTYANSSLAPDTTPRDVTVTINDGISDNSPIAHAAITVSAVNNAPSITAPTSLTIAADVAHAFAGNVNVADVDAGSANVQVTLTATNGIATLSGTSGLVVSGNGTASVVATGPIASQNTALNGMTFTPTHGYSGAASLEIDIDDLGNTGSGGAKTATKTIALTVDQIPAVTTTVPTQGASAGSTATTLTVNFSEAVSAGATAFALECPVGTPRALAPWSSSPATSFVLTPLASLPPATACQLTVSAAQVSDSFGQHLASNYGLGFTTNTLPTVTSTTPANGATGVQPSATITVNFSESVNATGSSFTLECPAGSPTAFTVSSSPAASFILTPSAPLTTGVTCAVGVVAAQVTDTSGQAMAANYNFGFTVAQPPAITSANAATFTVGSAGSFTVTSTGSPTATLAITAGALPAGVTFTDNGNGSATLAGTPAAGNGGSYPLTITASNGVLPNATQSFTLTVNQAPAITSANAATFSVGSPGTFTVTTSGVPIAATVSIGSGLPSGLTFTNNGNGTATIAGTPAAGTGGTYTLTITAINGVAPNATQSFTLTVNQAPAITSANYAEFTVGTAGSFTFTTSGHPAPTLAITDGTLPSGIAFTDNGNGTASLSGTPAASAGGEYPLTITASNGVTPNGTQLFVLYAHSPVVAVNDTYTVLHDTVLNVVHPGVLGNDSGSPQPAIVSVTGSGAPCTVSSTPCTVDTAHGSLTLVGDGSFTYTPAADFAGTDTFTYVVYNLVGSFGTATVTITVTNAAPVVDLNGATAAGIDFAATFTEGGGDVAIVDAAQLTVTDADDTQLTGATIIITNPLDGAAESLAVTCTDAPPACKGSINVADVSYTPATHTLEILATAPLADFQALLRSLRYANGSLAPGTSARDVTVTINDGISDNSPIAHAAITVSAVNNAPSITAPASLTIAADVAHAFAGNVSVADADAGTADVQVTLTATNGTALLSGTAGLAVSGNGTATVTFVGSIASVNAALNGMTFTPTNGYTGAASLRIDVDDRGNTGSGGAKTATKTIALTVDQVPAVTTTTPTQGASAVSTTSTLTVNFSEAVTATASAFTLECPAGTPRALAPWTSPPATSFVLTPTAALPQASSCVLTVAAAQVTDGFGQHLAANYTLSFTANRRPTVASTTPVHGATGVQPSATITIGFNEPVNASGSAFTLACPSGTPKNFTVSSSPATSFTLTPDASLPTGTTCTVGVVAAQVTDGTGETMVASFAFDFTVAQPPAITSVNSAAFAVGQSGTFTVTTTGSPGGASMVITKTGALPSGVTFTDNNNGTATIAGTPAGGTGGSYPITITASNGVAPDATQPFTLTVNQAPAITSANTITFVVGYVGKSFTVTTSGVPTATSITYGGALPTGLAFTNNADGTATITGTPAAGTGGSYPLTITASNGVPPNATQSFTLVVHQAPQVTSANNATFAERVAGSFTVTATGFPVPALAISGGTLPTGVSFTDNGDGTGLIAGTPARFSGGAYPFTISATSGAFAPATQAFVLNVTAPTAAVDDTYSTVHDTARNVTAPGVLTNDWGVPAPALTSVTGSGAPCTAFPCTVTTTNGSVTLNADGSFTYTPAAEFFGIDRFDYTASNAAGSSTATVTIIVTNEPPVVDLNGATAAGIDFATTFTEGGGAVAIVDAAQLTVTDPDDTQLTGVTIILGSAPDGAAETLAVTCTDAPPACKGSIDVADVTYTPATHTLEILATASLADFQALLRTLTYDNSSLAPDTTERSVTISITDGGTGNYPVGRADITIFSVNSAPTITAPTALTIAANVAHAFAGNVSVADPDAGTGEVQVVLTATNGIATLSGTSGLFVSGNGTATVTFVGSITSVNAALNGMTFTPTNGYTGAASLRIDVDDRGNTGTGGAKTATKTITLTVDQIPAVTTTTPTQGASAVSTTSTLTVNFSEAVTATASAFALECPAGTSRALAPWTSSPATSFVLTPTASLPQASSCVLTVAAAQVADGFGQHLSTNYTLNFTTNTLATVTSTIPANAATGVQPSSAITVNFSESVNATTASFTLQCPAGTPKAFTLSTSPATSFTLTPSAALPTGTACAVGVVAAQVTDTSGQAMAANYNFGFTVAEPPAITSVNNATFTVGNASSFTITTTGTPTVTSISMASVTPGPGGALPAGVSFSYTSGPNASLGGTPSNAAHVGTYVLSFTASNGVAPDAVQNPFTLTVSCPAISLTPSGVTFNATYGTPFSQAFTPAGGHAPYTYTLGGQALPGIAFSGNNLAGAPNNTGTFGFSVKAVDAYGCESATHSYMLNVDPKVGNDTFATTTTPVIGNVFVDSSRVPFSVLANDAFPAGATIIADATSHLGGNVSMTVSGPGMGQFTYDPPRGKTGDDYFRYSVVSNGRTVFGTVNITVANLVWFVDNTAACVLDCDGRQSHPYKTIAAFNAVNNGVSPDPQNGHAIFVYAGNTTTNYTGPLTLRASQKLFGQGSTSPLATLLGWSPGPGQVYPATGGTRPLLNGSGTATLTLGTGNTLNGLTLANSSGSGAALVGTSFGTLSIADLYIDSQGGGALNLNTGSVSGSFSSVKSTGGTNNVSLAGMSGNVTIASGQLTGASGNAFYVNGGNATIAYPGTIGTSGAAHSVNVANTTGGSVSFSGAITDNGGGIAFTGNGASSIINFTGGLTLRTAANPAFVATGTGGGNGTIYVTQDNTTVVNTIETTTGKAIEIAGVTIGGLTFRSINAGTAASGPANAIVINNTGGTAGLVVTGNGGACTLATPTCTGGQIQRTTGDAIVLTATNKTSLKLMNIHDNTGSGIVGTTMNGFTIDQSLVIDNGSDAATDDSGIDLVDLSGSAIGGANPTSITNTVIRNNYEFELQVTNGSGTLTDLQMSGNTISSDGTSGAHGNLVNFIGLGTANMKLTLTGGTFTGAAPNTATGVQCDHSGTGGAVTCNVSGATFTNNNVAVSMSEANGGAIKFNVANNVATGNRSHGLNLFVGASGAGGVDGTFSNNTVGTAGVAGSGSSFGYGIRVQNESAITSVSGVNVLVSGNTVQELLNFAGVNVNQGITGPFGSRTTNVTVTNNRVQHVDLSRAIIVQQNNATPGSYAGTTCVDISGNEMNNIAGVTNDGTKIRLRKLDSNGGVFNVRQSDLNALAAANSPPVGIASTTTTAAQISFFGTPTYNQPACPQPAP